LRTALAVRPVTAAGIAAVYRYRDPDEVRGDLDGLRAAGLIDATGGGAIEATERGRAVLAGMYQASAQATGQRTVRMVQPLSVRHECAHEGPCQIT